MTPILSTIRKLVAVHGSTSIAEVASFAGVSRARALDVIHSNQRLLLWERRKRGPGRITGDIVRGTLMRQWYEEGRFWRERPANYGSLTVVDFNNEGLFERLATRERFGGLGDSYTATVVEKTEANEAALRAAGLVPASELEPDDRLWKEPAP